VEDGGWIWRTLRGRQDVLDFSVGECWFSAYIFGCLVFVLVVEGTEIWVAAENAYNGREPDYWAVT
jgi:hypothetical protein